MTKKQLIKLCFWISLVGLILLLNGGAIMLYKTAKDAKTEQQTNQPITLETVRERAAEAKQYIVVAETIEYYKTHKNNNGYNQDPEYLLKIWALCNLYAELITDTRWVDTIKQPKAYREKVKAELCAVDIPLFMFCVSSDESNFNPAALAVNRNKTTDKGITQINQVCFPEIDIHLTPELRERCWTDEEKNIAGRYVWIMNRIKAGQKWDIMTTKRGWALYRRINTRTQGIAGEKSCL